MRLGGNGSRDQVLMQPPIFVSLILIRRQKKFDDGGAYRNAWIAEGQRNAPKTALDFYDAIPQAWNLRPDMRYPDPIVDLSTGRNLALESYKARTF